LDQEGDSRLLFAADGILPDLIARDPKWAGYCAVLVNIHDIAAMGGTPIALVNVLQASSSGNCYNLVEGLRAGCEKFSVPMVGGHFHPDAVCEGISVAVLGTVKEGCIVYSNRSRNGDELVYGVDLEGQFRHPFNWDSTSKKPEGVVRSQLGSMVELGERSMVSSGKDVSNAGLVGTLAMMCETSGVGAKMDLDSIPTPRDVSQVEWLLCYPGMGFIVSCSAAHTTDVIEIFEKHGLSASRVGVITAGHDIFISSGVQESKVFDLKKRNMMGLGKV